MCGISSEDKNLTYLHNQYRQVFRNLNAAERERKLDVDKWMKYCKDSGAEVVFIDMKTQSHVLYDSSLIPKSPVIGDRDLGIEVSKTAEKYGLKWCAYIAPISIESMREGRDSWQQRKADGSLEFDDNYFKTNFCYNSDFIDLYADMLNEIASKYRPHGFYIDGMIFGFKGCFCESCKAKYLKEIGKAMPLKPDWDSPEWHEYTQWRYRQIEEAAKRVHEAIHSVDPQISIVWNCMYCCTGGWYAAQSPEQGQWLDYACAEVCNDSGRLDVDDLVWGCLSTRAIKNGDITHHYTYFKPDKRLAEAKTIFDFDMALGALPCVQEHCRFLPEIMDRVKEMEPYLEDMVSASDIALHRSDIAHSVYYQPSGDWRDDKEFHAETKGVLKGLQYNHLPTEIILDNWLDKGDLSQFRTVILPNSVHLSADAISNLKAYLEDGGTVVATMETGLRNSRGTRDGNELLWKGSGLNFEDDIETCAPVVILESPDGAFAGVEDDISALPDQFMVFDKNSAECLGEDISLGSRPDGLEARECLQLEGFSSCHLPTKAIEVSADGNWDLIAKLRYRRDKEKGWEECPALLSRSFGKGRIVYANFQLGTLISNVGHVWWRNLIGKLLEKAAGSPPIEIHAPTCVRFFIWQQPEKNRYVLHILNELSTVQLPGVQREDHVPVPAKLKISLPGLKNVEAVIGGDDCRIQQSGDSWNINHPALKERLILVCEYTRET